MEQFTVRKIGTLIAGENGYSIALAPTYAPALEGLDGFGHIQVLWWFSGCDNDSSRSSLQEQSPYRGSPATLGTFATRSPQRLNPIALSCAGVTYIDTANATIGIDYIDAENGSPVLDIKPYTPSLDRVEKPAVPAWCDGWPSSLEESGDFDWDSVFSFT